MNPDDLWQRSSRSMDQSPAQLLLVRLVKQKYRSRLTIFLGIVFNLHLYREYLFFFTLLAFKRYRSFYKSKSYYQTHQKEVLDLSLSLACRHGQEISPYATDLHCTPLIYIIRDDDWPRCQRCFAVNKVNVS